MDNLSAHKVSGVREALEGAGARLLYLPAYSPDFNPIEMAFEKLKACLRKAAARTVDHLLQAITEALDAFTKAECKNYFTAAGVVQRYFDQKRNKSSSFRLKCPGAPP